MVGVGTVTIEVAGEGLVTVVGLATFFTWPM
jgi:hypothetical protein